MKNRLLVLVEAQSTWSYNILLRLMLYLADTLHGIIRDHEDWDIHSTARLPVPAPEFYVIYTGRRPDVPDSISLSRDFFRGAPTGLELTARVISMESTDDIIGQYIIYTHVFDQQIQKYGYDRRAAEETIRICKDRGALKAYLTRHEKEVLDGMMLLFDQEESVRRYGRFMRSEGQRIGQRIGQEIGQREEKEKSARRLARNGGDVPLIMAVTELPEAEARRIYEEVMADMRQ